MSLLLMAMEQLLKRSMGERLSIACIREVKTPLQELGGQRGDIFNLKLI